MAPETSGRPGYASARGPPARIEDTVEQVAGEDRVAVAMRRDGFQASRDRSARDLVCHRELATAHGIEKEDAGDEGVAAPPAFDVLVEMEVDGD